MLTQGDSDLNVLVHGHVDSHRVVSAIGLVAQPPAASAIASETQHHRMPWKRGTRADREARAVKGTLTIGGLTCCRTRSYSPYPAAHTSGGHEEMWGSE
jgi:hypothetical protein